MNTLKKAVLALGVLAAAASQAAEFTLLVYERPEDLAMRTDATGGKAYWDAYSRFAATLAQAGVLRGGAALAGPRHAAADHRSARVGGYFVIEATDLDAARRWAHGVPARAAFVEVLVHQANPSMAQPETPPLRPGAAQVPGH
jgi:hypothetical protein